MGVAPFRRRCRGVIVAWRLYKTLKEEWNAKGEQEKTNGRGEVLKGRRQEEGEEEIRP